MQRGVDVTVVSSRACAAVLLGMVWAAAGTVHAQAPAVALSECHAIADAAQRLECYDRASGRDSSAPGTGPAPAAVPIPAPASPERPSEAARAAPAPVSSAAKSAIDASWGFDPSSDRYDMGFYLPNYLLVARYSNSVNNTPFTPLFQAAGVESQGLDSTEAKYQLSFKARVWTTDDRRWGLWVAYTQQSQWQVYNDSENVSRAFRETNYMPEVFVSYRPDVKSFYGFNWRLLNVGFNHQSNGRSDPLSRSWNRIFAEFGVEREDLALFAKLWYRINESSDKDDNPDITDYYGYGELRGVYRWRGHSFSLSGRGNLSTHKGAAQFGWFSPRLIGPFRAYVQAFTGYGESMIDYNWKQTTIGIGVVLNDGI